MSVCLALTLAPLAEARTWTDSTGTFTLEAELVKLEDERVHLKKKDGSVVAVPIKRLSDADQRYLAQVASRAAPPAADSADKQGAAVPKKDSLQAKLEKQLSLQFIDTPLRDITSYVQDVLDVPIYVDRRSLQEQGIAADAAVTFSADRLRAGEALGALLEKKDLAWYVQDGVIIVATNDTVRSTFDPRVYQIKAKATPDEIIEEMTRLIAPQSWSDVGGRASVSPLSASVLVVNQSPPIHREIARYFGKRLELHDAPTPPRNALEKVLHTETAAEFIETPLKNVVDYLSSVHRVNLALDSEALKGVGAEPDSPVTVNLSGVSLATLLDLMLGQLDLTWITDKGRILITTPEEASNRPQVATYELDRLARLPDRHLANAVQKTVAPATWSNVGGQGDLQVAGGNQLSVRQPYPVQRQISALLADLEAASK